MSDIGKILKKERIYRNMTIKELANKISKSSPYISMIENGKSNPSSEYLYSFSKALFDRFTDEDVYLYIVAETYIRLCIQANIQIKDFAEVNNVLKNIGMHESNKPIDESYYLLNWLLMQEKEDVMFGVEGSFNDYTELVYLDLSRIFNKNLKKFIKLDKNDKNFILNVITNYIEGKYGDEILYDSYNDFVVNFDEIERKEFDGSKISSEDLYYLAEEINDDPG